VSKRGRYEGLVQDVLHKSKAMAAVVIVVRGRGMLGTGVLIKEEFSVAGGEFHVKRLPKILRQIAKRIEGDDEGKKI
jgi:hypothetical protein